VALIGGHQSYLDGGRRGLRWVGQTRISDPSSVRTSSPCPAAAPAGHLVWPRDQPSRRRRCARDGPPDRRSRRPRPRHRHAEAESLHRYRPEVLARREGHAGPVGADPLPVQAARDEDPGSSAQARRSPESGSSAMDQPYAAQPPLGRPSAQASTKAGPQPMSRCKSDDAAASSSVTTATSSPRRCGGGRRPPRPIGAGHDTSGS
jgi:hypothetical protein